MDNKEAYNVWSDNYDTVVNKTRDLEAKALRETVVQPVSDILEIGCGTGKNTEYLQTKAGKLVGADFSERMLERARLKITAENVEFRRLDLCEKWDFPENSFDLITCSLALEHIENIDFVFLQAQTVLRNGGKFYIGELHPFKQYQGSKARFETASGEVVLECFVHNISEFFGAAIANNFKLLSLAEWFDDHNETQIPRVLTMVFEKQKLN